MDYYYPAEPEQYIEVVVPKQESSFFSCCSCADPDPMETNLYAQKPVRRPKPFAWTPEIIQKYSNTDNLKKPVYVPGKRVDGA